MKEMDDLGPVPTTRHDLILTSSGHVVARTAERFLGVTLDLWRSDDPSIGDKWGDASALAIELSPRLLNLARALSPGLLRIGGSPQDSVAYQPVGGVCPPRGAMLIDLMARKKRCAFLDGNRRGCENARWGKLRCAYRAGKCRSTKWWAESATQLAVAGARGRPTPAVVADEYYCSQVHPLVYDCLTVERWRALNRFAATAGLSLVFGLNGCLGRRSRRSPVDVASFARFFHDTAAARLHVWAFELGNELTGHYAGSDGVAPEALGADVHALSRALERYVGLHSNLRFPGGAEPSSRRPRHVGSQPVGSVGPQSWETPWSVGFDPSHPTPTSPHPTPTSPPPTPTSHPPHTHLTPTYTHLTPTSQWDGTGCDRVEPDRVERGWGGAGRGGVGRGDGIGRGAGPRISRTSASLRATVALSSSVRSLRSRV